MEDRVSGVSCCLSGLTFVITNSLHSFRREDAKNLIRSHGGIVCRHVTKETNYLLCDEDIGGIKSDKAKKLGVNIIGEYGLLDLICSSSIGTPFSVPLKEGEHVENMTTTPIEALQTCMPNDDSNFSEDKIGNLPLVIELYNWFSCWDDSTMVRKFNADFKKAVLIDGPPIGKIYGKLIAQMLGFKTLELIHNSGFDRILQELNMICGNRSKIALIVNDVDNSQSHLSDLIKNIKISKIPVLCFCSNSKIQKLSSLAECCLLLCIKRPIKQQLKDLYDIATSECLLEDENARLFLESELVRCDKDEVVTELNVVDECVQFSR